MIVTSPPRLVFHKTQLTVGGKEEEKKKGGEPLDGENWVITWRFLASSKPRQKRGRGKGGGEKRYSSGGRPGGRYRVFIKDGGGGKSRSTGGNSSPILPRMLGPQSCPEMQRKKKKKEGSAKGPPRLFGPRIPWAQGGEGKKKKNLRKNPWRQGIGLALLLPTKRNLQWGGKERGPWGGPSDGANLLPRNRGRVRKEEEKKGKKGGKGAVNMAASPSINGRRVAISGKLKKGEKKKKEGPW